MHALATKQDEKPRHSLNLREDRDRWRTESKTHSAHCPCRPSTTPAALLGPRVSVGADCQQPTART